MTFIDQNVSLEKCPALVLNADYRPLSYYPLSLWCWQDSIKSVFLDRVTIVSNYDKIVRSPSFSMRLPSVIALKNYINPQDTQRTLRAYEIKKFTKVSMIDWFKKTKKHFGDKDFVKIYFVIPRNILIDRINKRVDKMFASDVEKEVEKFNALKVKKDYSANKVIGIREISEYLKKEATLLETKEKISIKTRQYAKRQSTWSRKHMSSWQFIDPLNVALTRKFFK